MALRRLAAIAAAVLMQARAASPQSVALDLTQTVGVSNDRVAAAATQARAVGDIPGTVRFLGEIAWADRTAAVGDAFGAAYPYANRLQVTDAYAERAFRPGSLLLNVRGGRYRTPFGIHDSSDHAYIGFLRAPLIRYDDYYALSNNFYEQGVSLTAGVPRLTVEFSAGAPGDIGPAHRRQTLDQVVRAQGAIGPFVLGVSHIDTLPYQPAKYAHGDATFTGIDFRFMRDGVQVRGEWITGRPFDGTTTQGGYVDLLVHHHTMGVVTGLFRAERLAYETGGPHDLFGNRYTAGARVRLYQQFALSVNAIRQSAALPEHRTASVDVGLTYSMRVAARQ